MVEDYSCTVKEREREREHPPLWRDWDLNPRSPDYKPSVLTITQRRHAPVLEALEESFFTLGRRRLNPVFRHPDHRRRHGGLQGQREGHLARPDRLHRMHA